MRKQKDSSLQTREYRHLDIHMAVSRTKVVQIIKLGVAPDTCHQRWAIVVKLVTCISLSLSLSHPAPA